MSDDLIDPSKPPHALVEVREDGSAKRNDGVELKPANANPWYVLATVHGEHEDGNWSQIDWDLVERNARIWNGWACGKMSRQSRREIAAEIGRDENLLKPLTDGEKRSVLSAFEARLHEDWKFGISVDDVGLPDQDFVTSFADVIFNKPFVSVGQVFPSIADFTTAYFWEPAIFSGVIFNGDIRFDDVVFRAQADFGGSHFLGDAFFSDIVDDSYLFFGSAVFERFATFSDARFQRRADFTSAEFKGVCFF